MNNYDWNHAIETTPAAFHDRVQSTLNALPQKEEVPMKNRNIKRTVLIALAAVMLLTVGVFAASGNIAIITGHSGSGDELNSFKAVAARLDKGIKGLPEDISVPETFVNGFAFRSGTVVHNTGRDEDGAALTNYDSLSLRYRKGQASLDLCVEPDLGVTCEGESVNLAGTEVYLTETTYMVVDVDYQLSEEEQAAEDAGTMQFAYTTGVDTPERSQLRMVTWTQDGAMYQMFSMDGLTSLEDLTAMAAELINK